MATPPIAVKKDTVLVNLGDERIDPYYWMNDRENPEVIDYLDAENEYTEEVLSPISGFREDLFKEMKGRIKEDDESVPYKYQGYWYKRKYETGKEYPIYSRYKETMDAAEEILFDVNKMAEGHDYYQLGGIEVSPDNETVAFSVDTFSRRLYTIQFKNTETDEIYPDQILNTSGSAAWAADNKTVFYTRKNPESLRSYQIWKHKLGTDSSADELIYEEKDETFSSYVYTTKSKKFIIIGSYSTVSNEYRILPADQPDGKFAVFNPRRRDLEYSIDHFGNEFYIVTNKDGATNFKLMKTPDNQTKEAHWKEVIPHRQETLMESITLFDDYMVVEERTNGNNQVHIKKWDGSLDYYLPFQEESYSAYVSTNPDFDSEWLRFSYNSLTTPSSVMEINMKTKEQRTLKEQEVLDPNFDKENYESLRLWATAEDGTKIPMSVVYKKGIKLDGTNPLLLYGYGSYGYTIDPYFSTARLSLLDRGFIYVIAHVRGGQYLGRSWYEDGKMLHKKNTFTDFIACGEHLVAEKYTSPEHLYAMGGSAGGLLMGAIINLRPDLFNGVVAAVPFVDVVTTMLDESIPLTTGEFDEWGNPKEKVYYDYMLSYSPYDQVKEVSYPHLLVTSGLHDSQVQYWEPTKWVAKLRQYSQGDNLLLLHTNMTAGHSGASGRFERLKEVALEYGFLLHLEGIKK